jgi:hypothetical protein
VISNLHLVMHGVAVKKHCGANEIAALIGLSPNVTQDQLSAAEASGRVLLADGKYMLSSAGQMILRGEYSRFYSTLRVDPRFIAACDRFEIINTELKQVITEWQTMEIAGERVANDHSNSDYDDKLIDRLGDLHERFEPILAELIDGDTRLQCYAGKMSNALERVEGGAIEWVSDAALESYHTVWFELHEDLLRLLGRDRDE